jgi:hypothetical protein
MTGHGMAPQNQGQAIAPFTNYKLMTNYVFRNGTRISGVDAQTAGDELARIQSRHGQITAPLVVDEARPDEAPLHPVFEWNDAVAAEQHRQHQARTLIRSVQIEQADEPPLPAYVHVQATSCYHPAAEVARRVDLYEDAFRTACGRVAEAHYSLEQLKRLAAQNQQKCIDAAISNLSEVRKSLAEARP